MVCSSHGAARTSPEWVRARRFGSTGERQTGGGERKGTLGRGGRERGGEEEGRRGDPEYRQIGGEERGPTGRKDRTVDKTRRQTVNKQECVMLRWSSRTDGWTDGRDNTSTKPENNKS